MVSNSLKLVQEEIIEALARLRRELDEARVTYREQPLKFVTSIGVASISADALLAELHVGAREVRGRAADDRGVGARPPGVRRGAGGAIRGDAGGGVTSGNALVNP